MTNVAAIQSKLHNGWGKAARKLGANYSFYRGSLGQSALLDQKGNPLKGQAGEVLLPQGANGLLLDQAGEPLEAQDGSYLQDQTAVAGDPLLDQQGNPLLDQNGDALRAQKATGPSPTTGAPYASGMVSFNAEDMGYKKPNKYGKPTWYAVFDGSNAVVGDYLIGPQGTFFIAAMQPLLPILCVECNRTISLFTPQDQGAAGAQPYGGSNESNRTIVMNGWPASILAGSKGEKTEGNLPEDTRAPWWTILLPSVEGLLIEFGHQLEDDLGRSYTVSSAELGSLGYRITARLNVT